MPISINQVAARACGSAGTVSKVLNSAPGTAISPGTCERVRDATRALGYRPNSVTRALGRRQRQTDTLGILLTASGGTQVMTSYLGILFNEVFEAATRKHATMVFTIRQALDAPGSLDRLLNGRYDGMILFYQPPDVQIIPALPDAGAPCVMLSDWREDPRLACVDIKHEQAMGDITGHLLDLGHWRAAPLSTQAAGHYVPPRVAGFHNAFRRRGLIADEALVVMDLKSWEPSTVTTAVGALIALPPSRRPTALCCITDDIAGIAISVLRRRPADSQDVLVTGFNDDVNALIQHPPLTTVRQPFTMLSERGAPAPNRPWSGTGSRSSRRRTRRPKSDCRPNL